MAAVTHFIPSGIDISERKWVEREVQQRIAQLDLALESGGMGIWEWDIPADYVTWSSHLYEMFGYTTESFEPNQIRIYGRRASDDRSQLEAMIRSAFTGSVRVMKSNSGLCRGDGGVSCLDTLSRDGSYVTKSGSNRRPSSASRLISPNESNAN
jgi:PAS domain-containing protein